MSSAKPLAGIKVLDLSRVLAGPWSAQILADYGADVIKVERPGLGDDTRAWGPPWWGDPKDRMSAYYLSANRGKRSIAIDIATAEGAGLVRQLAAHADVVIENYKVGQLAKYALAYADLSAINPRLVYCSITGYGQDGPYAPNAGYDFAIQAAGGVMSITGEKDGTPGSEPQKVGVAMADLGTGVYATTAILAALVGRDRSGKGCHIDASLLDTQVALLANQASNYLVGGQTPKRMGNAHINVVPYQVFGTQDGHIVIAVGNDAQFARYCDLTGDAALALDPRFADNSSRLMNREVLIPILSGRMLKRSTSQWMAVLEPKGVPCAPILDIPDVFKHPQVVARGMRSDVDGVPVVAAPMRFDGQRPLVDRPPPQVDEHGPALREALARGTAWPG